MILTKRELIDFLADKFSNSIFNYKAIHSRLIDALMWDDDDPRDITYQDIMELEDQIAKELDSLLTCLENKVKKY